MKTFTCECCGKPFTMADFPDYRPELDDFTEYHDLCPPCNAEYESRLYDNSETPS